MNEEELIALTQRGASEAFTTLFNRYRPIVLALEQQYYLRDFDHEDWLQEGRIVFFQVINHFDSQRGSSLGSFFKVALANRIRSLLRMQQAFKRKSQFESVSLDDSELKSKVSEWGNELPGADSYLILQEKLLTYNSLLSPLEEKVMGYFLRGHDLQDLPAIMAVSANCVRGAFDRAKKKLTQHLLDES